VRLSRVVVALLVAMVAVGVVIQAVRPSLGHPAGPQAEVAAPSEVRTILQRRCYACHSDEPRLVWFDQIVPAYWLVAHDVREARAHLNFSELGTKPVAAQRAELFEAVNQIQLGAMPLPSYLAAHRGAGVSADELATLKAYLAPFAPVAATPADAPIAGPLVPLPQLNAPAALSLNGVGYHPEFANWKLLSITDRGDNNTLRIITANDVAIHAVEERRTSPWPDGSVFAKITYASVLDGQGNVSVGKFVQVEFMEKNAAKYARTKGWGYARYKGAELKPYGENAHFDEECVGCHAPMRDNDYVYTTPIARDAQGGGR
jgi:mono/diheme cytochrome c family protein